MLRRGVVPGVAGRGLVMPDVGAGVGVERHDRRQVQVVAPARAAVLLVPRRAVAHTDVEQVEFGVVGHRVPNRAAAADLPPLAARPGRRRPFQRGRLEGLRRVARHRVEAPFHVAGFGVVGAHVATHAQFGAAVADDHQPLHHARRAGDRVGLVAGRGLHRPQHLAVSRIQRLQPPVERAHEDLAAPGRDTAIDRVAAQVHRPLPRHPGVVMPQQRPALRVEGVDHAPGAGHVQAAVDHDRCGLHAAVGGEVEEPCEPQPAHVCGVDAIERTEALLGIAAPVAQPVVRLAIGRTDACTVHGSHGRHRRCGRRRNRRRVARHRRTTRVFVAAAQQRRQQDCVRQQHAPMAHLVLLVIGIDRTVIGTDACAPARLRHPQARAASRADAACRAPARRHCRAAPSRARGNARRAHRA